MRPATSGPFPTVRGPRPSAPKFRTFRSIANRDCAVRHLVTPGANIRVALSPDEKQRAQWSPQQFAEQLRAVADRLPPWFLPDYTKVNPDGPGHWMTLSANSYDMWLQPKVIEPADLKKISIPVLVVAGDHDFSSVEENAEIFQDLPNGQLIIVPANNHGTLNKRPELLNLAIREFLDQHDHSGALPHWPDGDRSMRSPGTGRAAPMLVASGKFLHPPRRKPSLVTEYLGSTEGL
jgi:pimeloyl-ACP methyl ester carboxylesterase